MAVIVLLLSDSGDLWPDRCLLKDLGPHEREVAGDFRFKAFFFFNYFLNRKQAQQKNKKGPTLTWTTLGNSGTMIRGVVESVHVRVFFFLTVPDSSF